MRFFKYLIFTFLTIFPVLAFSADYYLAGPTRETVSFNGSTPTEACLAYYSSLGKASDFSYPDAGRCKDKYGSAFGYYVLSSVKSKCLAKDYPAHTYFTSGSPIPTQVCKPNPDGTFCKFVAKSNPMVTNHNNNQSAITTYNVSETPVTSCQDLFDGKCDSSDPYGGCYTPPKDGCTRQSNGSIICPPEVPKPDVKPGCKNGETYCVRPPEGCGSKYVAGKLNGQSVCVKKGGNNNPNSGSSNTGGDGNGDDSYGDDSDSDGQGTGSNTSSSTSTSTSTSTSSNGGSTTVNVTNNNNTTVNLDTSQFTGAIKDMSNKLTDLLNDLLNKDAAQTDMTDTNSKLDQTNSKLDNINQNGKDTNSKLDQLIAKTGSENGTGNNPDGKDYTGILETISEKVGDISDKLDQIFSDEGLEDFEKIGTKSDSPIPDNSMNTANNALNSFANRLTFSSSACIPDFTITAGKFGSFTIPLSEYCELLALVKIFLQLATLIVCMRMFDSTVRAL